MRAGTSTGILVLVTVACAPMQLHAGSSHLHATFDNAVDLTGVGPLATGGPWDPVAVPNRARVSLVTHPTSPVDD